MDRVLVFAHFTIDVQYLFGAHLLMSWKSPNNLSVLGGNGYMYVEEKTTAKLQNKYTSIGSVP